MTRLIPHLLECKHRCCHGCRSRSQLLPVGSIARTSRSLAARSSSTSHRQYTYRRRFPAIVYLGAPPMPTELSMAASVRRPAPGSPVLCEVLLSALLTLERAVYSTGSRSTGSRPLISPTCAEAVTKAVTGQGRSTKEDYTCSPLSCQEELERRGRQACYCTVEDTLS
ncbi:hypothetical protein BCR37DRAFT_297281 [Protomyces lactucae-debilis]|uniref:Uncharacterized protein n=1 Tax=Protomyces lactucae-debilis TaxID=2754530 RepID=A0A1Y2FGV4_PROLT|nr:uncharacterized protein BCR37DRAFT_297281 [Protomyces lactucae-debilis]ORY83153.1 hypothetical protein BCR37DRAFT_297281 [Protomyces lactucae-debilis]